MTDREIVKGYFVNVWTISCLLHCIDWNQRHGLPLHDLPDRVQDLKRELNRFEDVLARIPDRKIRNVLRCRFALGYTIGETAEFLEVSRGNIDNIIKKLKPSERNGIHEDNPIEH